MNSWALTDRDELALVGLARLFARLGLIDAERLRKKVLARHDTVGDLFRAFDAGDLDAYRVMCEVCDRRGGSAFGWLYAARGRE